MGRLARRIGALALVATLGVAAGAAAQSTGDWPQKPIRVVVPYAVGGP